MKRGLTACLGLVAVLLLGGCGRKAADSTAAEAAPGDATGAECAVCGMVVDEQPAPRGQALHRDGHRAFLCSLGDLRAYAQAPNPRGKPVAVWVEGLPPDFPPASADPGLRPWLRAEQASFVVGIPRSGVMGRPVFSFADPVTAEAYARSHGGRATTWGALAEVPFDQDP